MPVGGVPGELPEDLPLPTSPSEPEGGLGVLRVEYSQL